MAGKLQLITLEKVIEMKENNEDFTLVEVLSSEKYEEGHVPGAINIELDQVRDEAEGKLEKGRTVVVYCGGYACRASTKAAKILMSMGYKDVLDFKGGKPVWKNAGLKLEQ